MYHLQCGIFHIILIINISIYIIHLHFMPIWEYTDDEPTSLGFGHNDGDFHFSCPGAEALLVLCSGLPAADGNGDSTL